MQSRRHFAFFDIAYHGLADGCDKDAYSWRLFADMGLDMLVCQSFSKNFGLYRERAGTLHLVCPNRGVGENVKSQLFTLIRSEYSTNPLYGARIVTIILSDGQLRADWETELHEIRSRMKKLRSSLVGQLKQLKASTPVSDHPRLGFL